MKLTKQFEQAVKDKDYTKATRILNKMYECINNK